jgi:hypothetical protein
MKLDATVFVRDTRRTRNRIQRQTYVAAPKSIAHRPFIAVPDSIDEFASTRDVRNFKSFKIHLFQSGPSGRHQISIHQHHALYRDSCFAICCNLLLSSCVCALLCSYIDRTHKPIDGESTDNAQCNERERGGRYFTCDSKCWALYRDLYSFFFSYLCPAPCDCSLVFPFIAWTREPTSAES